MATSSSSRETFGDSDTRHDEMHSTIEAWVQDLVNEVDDAVSSEQFREWLDVQSHFHDYSHRNTLLIKLQCPHATRVAGYRTWQNEFDRHVKEGETAIWIWAPIIAKRCPNCGNSPSYHERSDCEYNETSPDSWEKRLVGFRPAPVFDISQTDGEPLPDLETEARGDADELVPALLKIADLLEVDVERWSELYWSTFTKTLIASRLSIASYPSGTLSMSTIFVKIGDGSRVPCSTSSMSSSAYARTGAGPPVNDALLRKSG